jgi:hypothetical protein
VKGQVGIRLLAAVIAAAIVVPVASAESTNGVESKTPAQIVAAAIAASRTARTAHVSAALGKLGFSLSLVAGKGGKGRMTQNGVAFDLVRIGKLAYFRGTDKFWRRIGGQGAVQLFHGKWMRASAVKGDLSSLTPITDLTALTTQALGSHGKKLVKGKTTTVHGQRVIAVKDVTKGGTLYVAIIGKPYPVAITNPREGGTVYFDKWDAPVSLSAPRGSIDISKLKK